VAVLGIESDIEAANIRGGFIVRVVAMLAPRSSTGKARRKVG